MGGQGDLHELFPYASVRADALFFDAIYYPRETKFLQTARHRGHICIEGLDLLVHQGAVSYETFTGNEADPAVMMDDVLEFMRKA
jgi:shikimate dehydrogenase